jgi:hypothetical protein
MVQVTSLSEVYERLRLSIVAAMRSGGFDMPPDTEHNVHSVVIAWFRVAHRSIVPAQRSVDWSKQLRARHLAPELLEGVQAIETESIAGIDLNPRLTRRFFKAKFSDRLFNDLRVQHLHLGKRDATTNGLIEGTSDLLYVLVQPQRLLFLDVLEHSAISSADFLEYLRSNWPDLAGPPSPYSPQDRAEARAAGLTLVSSKNGQFWISEEGGIATDGTSARVIDQADRLLDRVDACHRWIVENSEVIAQRVQSHTGVAPSSLALSLQYDGKKLAFEDANLGVIVFPEIETVLVVPR